MELALREAGKDTAALGLRHFSHHAEERWELDLEILILMGQFLPLLLLGCAEIQEVLATAPHLLLRSLLAPSPGTQGCPESDLGAPMLPLGHCFGKSKTEPSFPQSAGAQSTQKAKHVFIQSVCSNDMKKPPHL